MGAICCCSSPACNYLPVVTLSPLTGSAASSVENVKEEKKKPKQTQTHPIPPSLLLRVCGCSGGPGLCETLPRPLGWGIPPHSRPSSLSHRGGSDQTLPNKLIFYSFVSYVGVFHDKRRGGTRVSRVLSPPPSRRAPRRAPLWLSRKCFRGRGVGR